MNIGRQWEDRLNIWAEQFEKHYIVKHAAVAVSYFTTMEHLPFHRAGHGVFSPVQTGMTWGAKWEYGWFRTSFTVPEELAGERLVLCLGVGEEMLVWVNGRERGAIDKKHKYITLTRSAVPGETFDVMAECYAGHGVRNEGAGPVAPGEETVPEPPAHQVKVQPSFVGVWNETVFQAAMDYLTLYSLVKKLPGKSLRAMKIIEGLKKFTLIADFELPRAEMTASLKEAAKVLQPLLQCTNGSTAPEYTIFGQSHLDMAWLWPVEETMRKTARTYANQLTLMEEYPEYRFLLCEPPILEYLRELYPEVYRRVLDKVQDGSMMPEGAMWIESDTNIPSGESLIRQFVRGRRWFRDALGADSRMAWMPDTFGFSAALPQIMKKSGVDYFATQKLLRQDPEAEPFPYNLFWWEGMDGSRILSHVFKKNNANFDAGDLITRWENDRIQQENIDGLMYPFGFGDGGGGPTRTMLEMARRCADLEGAPRCRMESPAAYFRRAGQVDNVYTGELYLAWHRGTLTAQTKTKRGIRRAEIALKKAEYALAQRMLAGADILPEWKESVEQWWKLLQFNQFHDIAPGTSIARVHERAERELADIVRGCEALVRTLLGEGNVLHNHLSWPVNYRGQVIPAQGCAAADAAQQGASACNEGGEWVLRNAHLVCRVNGRGEVTSVMSAVNGREYLHAPGNRLDLFKDVNTCYDAWEIGSMACEQPVPMDGDVHIALAEDACGAALEVTRMLHHSPMTQRIVLGHDAHRLEFITRVEWQEKHKLLKAAFPVNVHADEALHEIQFGYVKRPTTRSTQHDKDRYEVCNHRYTALGDGAHGAAVLNDGKYGVSTRGSDISLTLLRAPMMPDMYADRGVQEFTYAFCPFEGDFRRSHVLHQAVELNEAPIMGSGVTRPIILAAQPNIVVETIKPADTADNALMVRIYEAMGMATEASFTLAEEIGCAGETDMLEENVRTLPMQDGIHLTFGAFEIKTLLLHLKRS